MVLISMSNQKRQRLNTLDPMGFEAGCLPRHVVRISEQNCVLKNR